ncbi:hypothetical protein ACHWQZ_G002041 [Mnemiopsis leidyi]
MKKFCDKHVTLAKEKHYKKLFVKYQDCSKKQWQIINGLLNRSKKSADHIRLKDTDGSIISSEKAVADRFNNYFSSIAANIKTQIDARRTFDPGGFKQYLKSPCPHSIFLNPTSSTEVYDTIRKLKNKSTLDCKIEPLKIANASRKFTETFAKVINASFSSGVFPSALKIAKVIPIHKGGSKTEVSNYRPISLLGSMSKVYEKLMHSRVLDFLDKNNSLFENQYGFRPESKSIDFGVPQGSILGPLLFVIYINDLPGISNLAKFILYADDANIIVSGSSLDEVSRKVNELIGSLVDWAPQSIKKSRQRIPHKSARKTKDKFFDSLEEEFLLPLKQRTLCEDQEEVYLRLPLLLLVPMTPQRLLQILVLCWIPFPHGIALGLHNYLKERNINTGDLTRLGGDNTSANSGYEYYNPYERSSTINLIGEKTDEGRLYETNLFNNISEILLNCKYQQPKNVKNATYSELKVFSLNIRSLSKNMTYFREENELFCKFDVLCFNETNCCSSKLPNGMRDLEIDGFLEPIAQEPVRKSGKGGGLAIYINKCVCNPDDIEEINPNLEIHEDTNGEFQALKIRNFKNTKKSVVIVNFYRSPSSNTRKFIEKLESVLASLDRHSRKQIVFFGDANIDLIKYERDANGQELISTLEKYGFVQTVAKPTRVTDHSATLIDHVYTNHVTNVVSCNILTLDISDHLAISTNISIKSSSSVNSCRKSQLIQQDKKEARVFNEANHARFKELIDNESWECIADDGDADKQYETFHKTYMKHYDQAYPLKRNKVRRKFERANPKPWILPWLEAACNRKNLSYFEKVKCPTEKNCKAYKKMKKFCDKHVTLAKEKHYKKLFVKYHDCSKKQWQIINGLLNRSKKSADHIRLKDTDGSIISSKKAVADRFNSYFSSIAANIKTQIDARRTFDPGGFKQYLKSPCPNSIFLNPTSSTEVYDIIRKLKNKSTLDCKIEPLKVANASSKFTEMFAKVINTSFSSGVFPSALKIAKVIPIHKGGSKTEVSNYRPISLLGSMSKVYEKLMHSRVLDFLDKNNSLFENQYGFRPGISSLAKFILYADDANIIVSGSSLDEVSRKANELIGSLVDWPRPNPSND